MHTFNRLLWRRAQRVLAAYEGRRCGGLYMSLPEAAWSELTDRQASLAKARRRGWHRAAAVQHQRLSQDLAYLTNQLLEVRRLLDRASAQRRPTAVELFEELQATEDHFGEVHLQDNELWVVTDAVILEGIGLGPFEIRLELGRLQESLPFRVVALEPNPASSCSDTTHPHVNNEHLCCGDGRAAIAAAIEEGRLSDFFIVVERILQTYAEGSAYVELSQWFGISCRDCGGCYDSDETSFCNRCDETLCTDCVCYCERCGTSYCSGCIDRCEDCEDRTCGNCLSSCRACGRSLCGGCLEDRICQNCLEESTNDETEEPTTEGAASAAAPL